MIERSTIERIKDTANILEVVSDFVSLRKVGTNYRGLCPFHDDHSPSFYVTPSKGICHCFVCGEGGDSVGFIMKHEQLSYVDALKWLANKYHIEVKETQQNDEQRKEQAERDAMFIVNEWAANYFNDILENDIDGRAIGKQYFRQRGIRDDIIKKFRLGFCLSDRQAMAKAALGKGYLEENLVKTGLCYKRDNGELVDRFSGRAIFPWIGLSGKVVAFGGRVLDSRTKGVNQKYVNSPDSIIYHKERELYGIFQAKRAIGKEDCVYMVEGYTDVISMHQCGIENVVANSGTALSEHQIRILHRLTSNIVLLYDGDGAGIKAALRGIDMLLKEGMNVKVMLLPDGDDPDSFAKKHNAEEFRNYINQHQTDAIEFKISTLYDGISDPIKKSEAITSIIKSVSVIGDTITRATYIQLCSYRLGINEQILTSKMNEEIRNYRDEKRKEEDRRRRNETAQYQNYKSTGQQPPQNPTTQQVAPTTLDKAPSDTTPSESQRTTPDGFALPPDDAFLPPEAFSQVNTPSAPEVATPAIPIRRNETVADMLLKIIIKYGNNILYENVETEDGDTTSLTVAQYIKFDLAQDQLLFADPLYNKILDEAAEFQHSDDFDNERFFNTHPDYEVSSLSISITAEKIFVSPSLVPVMSDERLRENITHLLLDFRKEFIDVKIQTVNDNIRQNTGDYEKQFALMKELKELQNIRNMIAEKIGSSVISR